MIVAQDRPDGPYRDPDRAVKPPATVHLEARDRGPATPTSTAPAAAVAAAAVANPVADPNRSESPVTSPDVVYE